MQSDLSWPWLLFHLFQIIVFQFYAAPRLSELGMILTKKRNPSLANNITSDHHLHPPLWDYLVGVISVLLLLSGYFLDEVITYRIGHYTSVVSFLMTCLVYDGWRFQLLKKLIPLEDLRRATLEPRNIGRTIPVWAWLIFLAFSVIFYILPEKIFVVQLTRGFAILVFLIAAWFIDKRKPVTSNLQDDLAYRESEAWVVYIVAWLIPLTGVFKQYISSNIAEAAFAATPLLCFIFFLNSPIYKRLKS